MAQVHLICGRICSGKSLHSRRMQKELGAVILSCDEVTTTLFPDGLGAGHDAMMPRVKQYLLQKTEQLIALGVDVILEWGFWCRADREAIAAWLCAHDIAYTWYLADVPEETWKAYIEDRNARILRGETQDYYVDDGLRDKCLAAFEAPGDDEQMKRL